MISSRMQKESLFGKVPRKKSRKLLVTHAIPSPSAGADILITNIRLPGSPLKSLSIFSAVISSPFSLTIVSRTDSFIILWYFSIFPAASSAPEALRTGQIQLGFQALIIACPVCKLFTQPVQRRIGKSHAKQNQQKTSTADSCKTIYILINALLAY